MKLRTGQISPRLGVRLISEYFRPKKFTGAEQDLKFNVYSAAGLKYRSQVTGQVTGPGHRSQVTGHNEKYL